MRPRARIGLALAACLTVLLPGCVMGPKQIDHGHLRYNRAIQESFGREVLLNLVRMRYREPAEFIDIGGVAAQYDFESSAQLNGNLIDGILNLQNLGIQGHAATGEHPTITYSPMRGKQFELCVLTPVDVGTLWLLANKGWRIDRLMRISLRSMNYLDNATSAGGPTPTEKPEYEAFCRATTLFRDLQKLRAAEFVLATREVEYPLPVAPEKLDGTFVLNATNAGYRVHNDGGKVSLTRKENYTALVIDPRVVNTPPVQELVGLLGVLPQQSQYEFTIARKGRIATAFGNELIAGAQRDETVRRTQDVAPPLPQSGLPADTAPIPMGGSHPAIALQSRSIYEMMYYLSQGVDVPNEHVRKGLVTVTRDPATGCVYDWNALLGDIFRVHVARWKPHDAYLAIPYRGFWYYVKDSDLESKSTLSLLQELFNLQVRGGAGEQALPVLTLGVGRR